MTPTPSAPTKTGVFWTQFPAHALTGPDGFPIDWSDHRTAHKTVSRLFAQRLPGDVEERRASAGILYRVDALNKDGEPTVLVQSLVAPELVPGVHRSTEVSRRAWDIAEGEQVAFRLAVNPVKRTSRYYTDASKKSETEWTNKPDSQGLVPQKRGLSQRDRSNVKRTARVVPVAETSEWLDTKIGAVFTDLQIVNHFRDTSRSGPHKVVIDTFDAIATVADPEELNRLRLEGVGRSRAYGCGLLTATRLG